MIQTVTKEQAKRIKELGVEIDCDYVLILDIEEGAPLWLKRELANLDGTVPAPTAEEMLDRMPSQIEDYSHNKLHVTRIKDMYHVQYSDEFTGSLLYLARDKELSIAVGDMFIWCAENKHLEVK